MDKYFLKFIKEHIVLSSIIVITVILSLFLFITFTLGIKSNYVVPQCQELLIILLFCIFANILVLHFIHKPKLTENIFIQILAFYLATMLLPIFHINTQFLDYYNFRKELTSEDFEHFPQKIPDNAKNIKVCHSFAYLQNDEDIMLKFDIDKTYIDNEIQKYKYEKTQHGSRVGMSELQVNPLLCENGNFDNYTTYIIKIKDKPFRYYGIATDNKSIVYYYTVW